MPLRLGSVGSRGLAEALAGEPRSVGRHQRAGREQAVRIGHRQRAVAAVVGVDERGRTVRRKAAGQDRRAVGRPARALERHRQHLVLVAAVRVHGVEHRVVEQRVEPGEQDLPVRPAGFAAAGAALRAASAMSPASSAGHLPAAWDPPRVGDESVGATLWPGLRRRKRAQPQSSAPWRHGTRGGAATGWPQYAASLRVVAAHVGEHGEHATVRARGSARGRASGRSA